MKRMKIDQNQEYHIPILLTEVINGLNVEANKWYVDATAGGGGHTQAIIDKQGKVLCIDQDSDAIKYLQKKFASDIVQKQIIIKQGNFREIKKLIDETGIKQVSGILFDLGMSTNQIKNSGRGFSFRNNEILDMRMSLNNKLTAKEIINHYSQDELYDIFRIYGEENLAGEIADAVCRARTVEQINNTQELSGIVDSVYKNKRIFTKINPATKVFQALRIEVNNELENLEIGLKQAIDSLAKSGRCCVISFHSLEDRIVKKVFNEITQNNKAVIINKKLITAGLNEVRTNKKSRSAKLRIIQKI